MDAGRRKVLEAAGVVLGGLAATPLLRGIAAEILVEKAAAVRDAPAGFLNPLQLETVGALLEVVIPKTAAGGPGARDAKVHHFADRFLAGEDASLRDRFVDGLFRLNRRALKRHEKLFVRCSFAEQSALFGALAKGDAVEADLYENARTLAVFGFYTSAEGLAALGHSAHPGPYPGCTHGGHQ